MEEVIGQTIKLVLDQYCLEWHLRSLGFADVKAYSYGSREGAVFLSSTQFLPPITRDFISAVSFTQMNALLLQCLFIILSRDSGHLVTSLYLPFDKVHSLLQATFLNRTQDSTSPEPWYGCSILGLEETCSFDALLGVLLHPKPQPHLTLQDARASPSPFALHHIPGITQTLAIMSLKLEGTHTMCCCMIPAKLLISV